MDPIKLDDKEYTVEELQELVGYGQKYQEFSKKFDTDPEKAWRSYGKVTSENAELREKTQKLENLEKELEQIKSQQRPNTQGEYTDEQIKEAKKALRAVGAVTKEDLADALQEFGFVKAEDVDNKVKSEFATKELSAKFEDLGKRLDGKDGRPKFDEDEILSYMERNRISDPEKAYKMKHEEALSEWRAEKIIAEKYPQIVTGGKTSTKKEPDPVKVTKDNMKDLLKERLARM